MKGFAVVTVLVATLYTVWGGIVNNNGRNIPEGKLWTRSGKFEGDIVMSDTLKAAISNRNGIFLNNTKLKWPNSELVYSFSNELSEEQKNSFVDCLNSEFRESCVTIREAGDTDTDYVLVTTSGEGCYSDIGRQGGSQQLNLQDPGCYTCDTIVHEVLHALGFAHMQSDPLRDDYIFINWDNIEKKQAFNFDKYNWVSSEGVPYDYLSVMHYSWNDFAIDKEIYTMARITEQDKYIFGNYIGMTKSDLKKLNNLYCK